jgi:hypothetical protein
MTEFQFTTKIDMLQRDLAVNDSIHIIPETQATDVLPSPSSWDEQDDNQLFTKDRLEETFNQDFYKLCYNNNQSLNATTTHIVTKYIDGARQMLNVLEESENQSFVGGENNEEASKKKPDEKMNVTNTGGKVLGERTNVAAAPASRPLPARLTSLGDVEDGNSTYSFIVNGSIVTTDDSATMNADTGSMNETIMYTIREPFNYEFKNRLLNRGPLEQLKKNPKFSSVVVNMPDIKARTLLSLKNVNYNIIEGIGCGAFAKIFLIETKEKAKYALKVQ